MSVILKLGMGSKLGSFKLELTKPEYAMYIGTLNAIVKVIEETPKLTAKKLRHMLLSEIDTVRWKLEEKCDG